MDLHPFHPLARRNFLEDLCCSNCGVKIQKVMQCTYKGNIVARPPNNFCHRKIIRIACSECVSVAVLIQHVKRMRRYYIAMCGVSSSTTFFNITL